MSLLDDRSGLFEIGAVAVILVRQLLGGLAVQMNNSGPND
jgi:hypothetical protein